MDEVKYFVDPCDVINEQPFIKIVLGRVHPLNTMAWSCNKVMLS